MSVHSRVRRASTSRRTSSSRLLVQQGIADRFVERLTARVQKLKVGHPLDPATEIGPLIHERHLAKVCSYFDVAAKDGATIAVGGKPQARTPDYQAWRPE